MVLVGLNWVFLYLSVETRRGVGGGFANFTTLLKKIKLKKNSNQMVFFIPRLKINKSERRTFNSSVRQCRVGADFWTAGLKTWLETCHVQVWHLRDATFIGGGFICHLPVPGCCTQDPPEHKEGLTNIDKALFSPSSQSCAPFLCSLWAVSTDTSLGCASKGKFGIYCLLSFHTLIIQAQRRALSPELCPWGPIVHPQRMNSAGRKTQGQLTAWIWFE